MTAVALDSSNQAVGYAIQQDLDTTSPSASINSWATNLSAATFSASAVPLPALSWNASVEVFRNGNLDYQGSSTISSPGVAPTATILAPPMFDKYRLTQTLTQSAAMVNTRVDIPSSGLPSTSTWSITTFAQPVVPDAPTKGPPTTLHFDLGNSGTLGDAIVLTVAQQVVTTKSTTNYTYEVTLPAARTGQAQLPDLPADLQTLAYDRDTVYSVSHEDVDAPQNYGDYLALGGELGYAEMPHTRAVSPEVDHSLS